MKYRTIIILTDPSGKPVGSIEKNLKSDEYPSQTALLLVQLEFNSSLLLTGHLHYLGCEQRFVDTVDYIFHIFSGKKPGLLSEYEGYLYGKYAKKIASFDFMEDFSKNLPEIVSLNELIQVTHLHTGSQPDWELLKNGSGFLNLDNTLPAGCLNFPDAVRFIGMNIYQQGIPRGNHYHLHKVEYTYVLQGEIKAYLHLIDNPLEETEIFLKAGDLALFLPGSYHALTAVTETAYAIEVSPLKYEADDYYRK